MENYDSRGADGGENEGQEAEKEPDGAAAGLIARLGDAEGSEKGSREGLKEVHGVMVRGWRRGLGRIQEGTATSNTGVAWGLLQWTPGDRLILRCIGAEASRPTLAF